MKVNITKTDLKITAVLPSQFPADRKPQIAFSGRSNVGKSSLMNALIGRKSLARVSSSPGKTITVNFYEVDKAFYLVDLPGYGYARRTASEQAKWSKLVDGYFTEGGERVTAVAQLIDLKVGATKDDLMMLDFLRQAEIPFFVVATKADKPNKTERNAMLEKLHALPVLEGITILPFSAQSGEGKEAVIAEIMKALD
ncbi:MAG: YihA family ribosome biogenesis GTP-binding protein [Clostridia bacterium]|nr:YihA family ribosome biogenesis GTP-binding protein [Clostridia bacterium]